MVSEPKGNGSSGDLKSEKSAWEERSRSSASKSFPSKVAVSGVGGPAEDNESGDPGVSMTISTGSAGEGGVDSEVSNVKNWSRSVDEMSSRSTGDDGPSVGVEAIDEPDGDEERFDELERFRWLYLFFAASAVRPGK